MTDEEWLAWAELAGVGTKGREMSEAEWLACPDRHQLMNFLKDKVTDRKWWLFSIACWRRSWALAEEQVRRAMEVEELYADGLATETEMQLYNSVIDASRSAWHSTRYCQYLVAKQAGVHWLSPPTEPQRLAEAQAQAHLFRDIVGNPFHPVTLSPGLQRPTVLWLAQAAYEERNLPDGILDAARLAVLADALEEAGCTDDAILAHLRTPGPHVRGCWALDLVTGRC
jgi:hypothetical protein